MSLIRPAEMRESAVASRRCSTSVRESTITPSLASQLGTGLATQGGHMIGCFDYGSSKQWRVPATPAACSRTPAVRIRDMYPKYDSL